MSSIYLYAIICSWPEYILATNIKKFAKYFEVSLIDASSNCRQQTRLSFLRFREMFPDEAQELYRTFDEHAQKAIEEEKTIKPTSMKNSTLKIKGSSEKFQIKPTKLSSLMKNKKPTEKQKSATVGSNMFTRHSEIPSKKTTQLLSKDTDSDLNLEEYKVSYRDARTTFSDNGKGI